MTDSPFATAPNDPERSNRTCRLPGGRKLGYAEGGDPNGVPVFYFHGFPGSRLEATLLPPSGIRLIGVDRPGYGLSTPAPAASWLTGRRTLRLWPIILDWSASASLASRAARLVPPRSRTDFPTGLMRWRWSAASGPPTRRA